MGKMGKKNLSSSVLILGNIFCLTGYSVAARRHGPCDGARNIFYALMGRKMRGLRHVVQPFRAELLLS